jgi:V8-like Glu-specific endopeptidase
MWQSNANRSNAVAVLLLSASMLTACAAPRQLTPAASMGEQRPVAADVVGDYANVCHIQTTRRGIGKDGGSGSAVLYRGRYLITAAHNVYSTFYNRVTRIEVHCGLRSVVSVPVHFPLTNGQWMTARGYSWRPYARDIGVIRLPDIVPTSHPVELVRDAPADGTIVEIAGYPGDGIDNGDTLYAGSGATVASSDPGLIQYAINTTTGNSGGPVWVRSGQTLELVGIHVVGYRNGGGARRVDPWFRREVEHMIAELDRRAARADN